jgi:hypothetical protein
MFHAKSALSSETNFHVFSLTQNFLIDRVQITLRITIRQLRIGPRGNWIDGRYRQPPPTKSAINIIPDDDRERYRNATPGSIPQDTHSKRHLTQFSRVPASWYA